MQFKQFLIVWYLTVYLTTSLTIPLIKIKHEYYAKLAIQQEINMLQIDFFQPNSYLFKSIITTDRNISVAIQNSQNLGLLQFKTADITNKIPEVKGRLGLGTNSTFINMLEKKFKTPISLRFLVQKLIIEIDKQGCKTPSVGPFEILIKTWTSIRYETPLSFNLKPRQDFLAILNHTQTPLIIQDKQYRQKKLQLIYDKETKTVEFSKIIQCWKFEKSNNRECDIELGEDVGLLLFQYAVRVCKNGVQIGRNAKQDKTASYFLIGIIVNILSITIFVNWETIKSCCCKEVEQVYEKSINKSIEKISLIEEMV